MSVPRVVIGLIGARLPRTVFDRRPVADAVAAAVHALQNTKPRSRRGDGGALIDDSSLLGRDQHLAVRACRRQFSHNTTTVENGTLSGNTANGRRRRP